MRVAPRRPVERLAAGERSCGCAPASTRGTRRSYSPRDCRCRCRPALGAPRTGRRVPRARSRRSPACGRTGCIRRGRTDVRDLLSQQPRLVTPLLGQGDGHRRVAVDAVLGVQGGFAMACDHVELHRRRLQTVWSNGSVSAQVEELPDNKVRLTVDVPRGGRPSRRRACGDRPRRERQGPGLPQGQGADAGARLADRQGAALLGGDREPHRRLVLERRGASAHPARRAAGAGLRAPRVRRPRLALHCDGRVLPKPEVADWTKLQVPYAEPEMPEDFVDHELNVLRSTVAELCPSRAGRQRRRHGRPRPRSPATAASATTSSSSARAGCCRSSRSSSSG